MDGGSLDEDFNSEEEDEETVNLAREEAAAAFRAGRTSSPAEPTRASSGSLAAHIPEKAKEAMAKTVDAIVNAEVHDGFSTWIACEGHHKTVAAREALEQEGGQQSLIRWFEDIMKSKSLKQWQAKALHLQAPSPAVLNCQTKMGIGKLLCLKYA